MSSPGGGVWPVGVETSSPGGGVQPVGVETSSPGSADRIGARS